MIAGQRVIAEEHDVTRLTVTRWLNQITGYPKKNELVALARRLLVDYPEFTPAKDEMVGIVHEKLHCTQ